MDAVGIDAAFSFLKADIDTRDTEEAQLQADIQPVLDEFEPVVIDAIEEGTADQIDYRPFAAALSSVFVPFLTGIFTRESLRTSAEIGIGFDPAVVNTAAIEWARTHSFDLITGLTERTRALVQKTVASFFETPGMTQGDLEKLLEPAFGQVRARMISITEVTRATSGGTTASQRMLAEIDVPLNRIWNTANDERVCFPAGTKVHTDAGQQSIELVQVGQLVLTRKGYKRVRATHRRDYVGEIVTICHKQGRLTCTAEHPVWVLEKGWLKARDVHSGDRLQTVTNQESFVYGVFQFNIGDTHYRPTTMSQVLCLAGVSFGVLMPIRAVNLKGNMWHRQQKVNAVSAHSRLLDVPNLQSIKNMAHGLFKRSLALKSSITGKRAELTIGVTGQRAKRHATRTTFKNSGRASAFLRAIHAGISLLADREDLAAPSTSLMPDRLVPAFYTARRVAVGNAGSNGERLATDGAELGNHIRGTVNAVTGTAAKAATVSNGAESAVDFFSTDRARHHPTRPAGLTVAFGRAVDLIGLLWSERLAAMWAGLRAHSVRSLTKLQVLYHQMCATSSVPVYNLQVEDDPVFFADGVLVHNCPICGPLNGMPEQFWRNEFPEGPPAHPNCRGSLSLSGASTKFHLKDAVERGVERVQMFEEGDDQAATEVAKDELKKQRELLRNV